MHVNGDVPLHGLSSEETQCMQSMALACSKNAHLLNRWIVLDTGGNNLGGPPPDGGVGVLQQAQQRRQTPNGVKICSSMCCPFKSTDAETFHWYPLPEEQAGVAHD